MSEKLMIGHRQIHASTGSNLASEPTADEMKFQGRGVRRQLNAKWWAGDSVDAVECQEDFSRRSRLVLTWAHLLSFLIAGAGTLREGIIMG